MGQQMESLRTMESRFNKRGVRAFRFYVARIASIRRSTYACATRFRAILRGDNFGGHDEAPLRPIRDVKILLMFGYAMAYPLAVLAPILLDPRLATHPAFPARTYPRAWLCLPIYIFLLGLVLAMFKLKSTTSALYWSICAFASAIVISLPIFLPEFPHGNLLAVGTVTSLLFAFTIFMWSACEAICTDASTVSAGDANLGYLKELLSFVRQTTFAGVGVFSGLLYGVFTLEFEYINNIANNNQSDKFLLSLNAGAQVAFYAIFAVAGPFRYFFLTSMRVLSEFKKMAAALDNTASNNHAA
jgi:hypothetical protein